MIILDKTFDPVVKDWFNRVGKPGQANAINRCVKSLRDAGILKELDLFHLIGGLDTDLQRLRPLVTTSTTNTFTAVASPTLAYNGVTGNGSSSYLNLRWMPSTNAVKYSLNSASLGTYSLTQTAAATNSNMGNNISLISPRRAGDVILFRVNDGAAETNSNALTTGLISIERTGATSKRSYRNGASLGTGTNTTSALNPENFYLCCHNNSSETPASFTTRTQSMCFAGSSNIDQLKFYQIIQNYMTEVGLAV
jgi:hypothetical protein